MRWARRFPAALLCAAFGLLLAACGGGEPAATSTSGNREGADAVRSEDALPPTALSPAAALGRRMFFDVSLSASGRLSCASCHDPAHAHAAPNGLAVQRGGVNLDEPGLRAVPSLRYLSFVPAFGFDANGAPHGGYNRDGRSPSLGAQAEHPLLAANEMGLQTRENALRKLVVATYAQEMRDVYGAGVLDSAEVAFNALIHSLEQYQLQDREFRRFDSKYDAHLQGRVALSVAEARGLALFDDPARGNCAACHASKPSPVADAPLFSDFGYARVVPPTPQDAGLCGPLRADLANRADLCGMFRTPSLRNAARRQVFFHDGRAHTLEDAVRMHAGEAATLQQGEIDDLVAFLRALSDGWRPSP